MNKIMFKGGPNTLPYICTDVCDKQLFTFSLGDLVCITITKKTCLTMNSMKPD